MERRTTTLRLLTILAALLATTSHALAQRDRVFIPNEQGRIQVRDSGNYAAAPLPRTSTPPLVADVDSMPEWRLSLDEAIRVALQNTDVVRVLSGVGSASTGQTIYAPGVANAGIDAARAFLDPTVSLRNNFLRNETPGAIPDPLNPGRAIIVGSRADNYDFQLDVNKQFLGGAGAGVSVGTNRNDSSNSLSTLNPQSTSAVSLSLSQPLLRGRGVGVNSVPVVLAFLDTESSYFRLKNSLQNMVAGVIQGYWGLVQARIELWVIEQQIRQSEGVAELELGRLEAQISDAGQAAQAVASLANFRANLITAKQAVLNRVASLRGILGLPPGTDFTIVPTTPPVSERLAFDWDSLVGLAEQNRPDLVELKIVLEADRQRILQAANRAQPQLDAVALYRWNGLEGQMPIGDRIEADPGQHTDWSLAVNFSVPFTLRADRASLRQTELLLASDRANLKQGLLSASHSIANLLRNIDSLYRQYDAFQVAREAAEDSLVQQLEQFRAGRINFVEVLLAINTWAGSVTSEARAITNLNSTFATLEAETGTILESHGVRLFEERYCSLGPLGKFGDGRHYPAAYRPSPNVARYAETAEPSEEVFNLQVPNLSDDERESMQRLPADDDDSPPPAPLRP